MTPSLKVWVLFKTKPATTIK